MPPDAQDPAVAGRSVDVGALIDAGGLSGYQLRLLVLCGLVAVLDGIDTFSIGVAAPSIAASLGMQLNAFGAAFSAALFGATLGAFGFGPLADRFGRKAMLVTAVLIFAAFTLLTAFAWSVPSLLAIRFLAGVGLGGATPCFLALASEYVPTRMRATVTAALWSGFPLGGMLGGFLNSWLIHAFDWRAMFYVGGVAPLVVAGLLMPFVPESVRYLIAAGAPPARVAALLGRLAPGRAGRGDRYVVSEAPVRGVTAVQLFTQGRGAATPLLWVPFFMAFGVLAIVVLWTPALLRQDGMSGAGAAIVVGFHGMGGFVGMAMAGRLLERFGARVLVPAFVVGAACTAALGMAGTSVALAALCDGLIGLFVGIGASGMIAVCVAGVSHGDALDRDRLGDGNGAAGPGGGAADRGGAAAGRMAGGPGVPHRRGRPAGRRRLRAARRLGLRDGPVHTPGPCHRAVATSV